MSYRMNIANELAQAKYCKTLGELEKFCEDHNISCTLASINKITGSLQIDGYYEDNDIQMNCMIYLTKKEKD